MTTLRKAFVLIAVMLVLSACSLVAGKREDLTVYAPALVHTLSSHAPRAWQLVVAEPKAIGPLNANRMVVYAQPGVVQFYKNARWRDSAPILILEMLLQAFQDSANLAGIGTPTSRLRADFVLQLDLQEFQAEYRSAQAPTVVIRLSAQFVDNSTNRALATHTFTVEQPCTGTDLPSVFAGFQEALNRTLPLVVAWAAETGDVNWHAKHPAIP